MSLNEISDWMTECNFVFQKSIIIVKIWNQYVSLQFGVFGCISAISILLCLYAIQNWTLNILKRCTY